ncbi:DsrE family protein [Candidatus Bathyarchaeota archaeon]|nr:DsrE family protein [Candidatus Bathyarchaeota archaeon]MBS7630843.1 DsrE family protein [Candidatus Bathyarchaeota archaeon]
MLITIVVLNEKSLDKIYEFSKETLSRRHELIVFLYSQGVKLIQLEKFEDLEALEGIRLLACQTSLRESGFDASNHLELKTSSLSELVELLERSDRVIFIR